MIKVGDTLPSATLMEYSEVEGGGCSLGPNTFLGQSLPFWTLIAFAGFIVWALLMPVLAARPQAR